MTASPQWPSKDNAKTTSSHSDSMMVSGEDTRHSGADPGRHQDPPALFQLPDLSSVHSGQSDSLPNSDGPIDTRIDSAHIADSSGSAVPTVHDPTESKDQFGASTTSPAWRPLSEMDHPNDVAFAEGIDPGGIDHGESEVSEKSTESEIDPDLALETWGARAIMIALLMLVVTFAAVAVRSLRSGDEANMAETAGEESDSLHADVLQSTDIDTQAVTDAMMELAASQSSQTDPNAVSDLINDASALSASDVVASDTHPSAEMIAPPTSEEIDFNDPFFADIVENPPETQSANVALGKGTPPMDSQDVSSDPGNTLGLDSNAPSPSDDAQKVRRGFGDPIGDGRIGSSSRIQRDNVRNERVIFGICND